MDERPGQSSWRMDAAMAAIAAVLAVAVFAGTLRGGWVYDDEWLLHRNLLIQEPGRAWEALTSDIFAGLGEGGAARSPFWRPTWTGWMIVNHRLFGLEQATPWRLGNLGLHVLVTVLAYAVMRRLGLRPLVAGGAACILAVHPTRVETVSWISGVPDVLAAAALLGSMLCVLRLPDGLHRPDLSQSPSHSRWKSIALWAGALILYAIALGAKEPTILYPVVVFAVYASRSMGVAGHGAWWRDRRPWMRGALAAMVFSLVALAYLLTRRWVLRDGGTLVATSGLEGSLKSLPAAAQFYLRQAIFPAHLSPVYAFDLVTKPGLGSFVVPLGIASASGAAMLWAGFRSRAGFVGLAVFLVLLAPAMAVGWMMPEREVQDRYLYLPLIGLAMLVASAASLGVRVGGQRRRDAWVFVAAAAACVPLAWRTVVYGRAWAGDEALWAWCVQVEPSSRFGWSQYGSALLTANKPELALDAMAQSLAIGDDVETRQARAGVLLRLKRYDEAERELVALLERSGEGGVDEVGAVTGLAQVWMERDHDAPRALGMCRDAREQLPAARASLTIEIASILTHDGRADEAVAELEGAREAAARERTAAARMVFYRLGSLYLDRGRASEAKDTLVEFLKHTEGASDPGLRTARRSAAGMIAAIDRTGRPAGKAPSSGG